MKVKVFVCIFFAGIFLSFKSYATNLRGRIARYNPTYNNFFPLQNVRVDLWIFNGAQWIDLSFAVTGPDGMYYFNGLSPGISFKIQVFGNFFPEQALMIYNVPLQDIPQINT
jgi:hypothetical protein